ncbi:cupin domain-containing protein [Rubellicoccus peritrichatus]|uniref:Cupin domain-containing protein n=1 Tax=Rubellicoccus peritrichatus TaxID=3080537 RepID=A0AAQ3LE26_9BACT|nr:cupin domain-containing protein [Puniceicoccus sp. CR14]WOO43677.1 cupin domain-containing protein [Puniceicoccus sp. CR14]
MANIFFDLPSNPSGEVFDDLLIADNVRIERIVSNGQITSEGEWYDQDWDEWVLVLRGEAELTFAGGKKVLLLEGDYHHISKGEKHRVTMTSKPTIWLAVHVGEKRA